MTGKNAGGRADNSPNETTQDALGDISPTNWHAACDDDETLACPECDEASIYRKVRGTRGQDRARPEDWQCKTCGAHFAEPTIRRRRRGLSSDGPGPRPPVSGEVFGDG